MKKVYLIKGKRLLTILLAGVLVIGTLSGCSKKANAVTGRYVEEEITLSGQTNRPLFTRYDKEGNLVYYVSQDKKVMRCVINGSGDTDSKEVTWLGTIMEEGGNLLNYSESEDGTAYALYSDAKEESKLARSTDGVAYEKISVPELENNEGDNNRRIIKGPDSGKINEKGGPITEKSVGEPKEGNNGVAGPEGSTSNHRSSSTQISKGEGNGPVQRTFQGGQLLPVEVHALKEGFLISYGEAGVYQYGGDGSLIRKYAESQVNLSKGFAMAKGNGISVYGDVLATKEDGKIQLYDVKTGNQKEALSYDGLEEETYIGIDKEGVFVGDLSGISQWKDGKFEKIMDGGLTSLIQPNLTISHLLRNTEGVYYAFLNEGKKTRLFQYIYDENIPKEPDTTLEVFSLYDNNTVRLAIAEYQRKNPNVRVNLSIGMQEDGGATTEDVIRALNTELIAGKGPDLVVLDGLPVDSYIEKGVLKDVTALKDQLVKQAGLMKNLTGAYEKDGKAYGLPSRFVLPVIMGNKTLTGSIGSLSELVDAVKSRQSKDNAVLRASEDLWKENGILMEYYEACVGSWMTEDGKIDEKGLADFFKQMLELDKLLKEITPETSKQRRLAMAIGGAGVENINLGAQDVKDGNAMIHIEKLIGMGGFMNIVSNLVDVPDMDLTSLFGKNQYYPQGGIGIVTAGKQQELAESFMTLIFSDEIQGKYLNDGFPVNENSIKKMVEDHLEDINEKLNVNVKSDMDFLGLCNGLTDVVRIDQVVKEKVQSQVAGLISGTVKPEQAASKVVEETRLYLME